MEIQVIPADPPTPTSATTKSSHVVVVPYPSRGHINPMMNLSKLLVSHNTDILVTFVVTQEWLSLIGSGPKPDNIRFGSIPSVVPELGRSADNFLNVVEAVMTEMEPPLEQLIDRLRPPPTLIIYDAFLFWAVAVGNRRNIPVAAFWTTSTSELWLQYFHVFLQHKHLENGEKLVDYIPATSWVRLADIPLLDRNNRQMLQWALKSCQWIHKAQYLLLPSIYELEPKVIDALKARLTIPIYTIGPNIPYFNLGHKPCYNPSAANNGAGKSYIDWLDHQPCGFSQFSTAPSSLLPQIYNRLRTLFAAAGFPPSSQLFSILNLKVSQTIVSSIFTLPFTLTFLLLAKASTIHALNKLNHHKPTLPPSFSSIIALYKPLLHTYICNCFLILSANATAFCLMFLAFSFIIEGLGYSSPSCLLFMSASGAVLFSVILANALVICNMALALSGMEGHGGYLAILKACILIRGRTSMALFLALPVNVALAAIEALFQFRVVRAYHVAGKERPFVVLEGIFIAYLYSIFIILDTIVSCLFYKSFKTGSWIGQEDNYGHMGSKDIEEQLP